MSHSFRRHLLTSTLLVGAAALASPVLAQDASPTNPPVAGSNAPEPGTQTQESAPTAPTSTDEIVVTGSLIRNPNLTSVAPVTVIGQNEIALRQQVNAEQLLRDIPGAVAGLGQQVNNGSNGANTVNLRGLGSNRNLVLLDGQRLVPFDLRGVTDLDNIPLALIERTDVLTGGASTTYGADAISGVINFITRSDFAGIDATATKGITGKGDGNTFRADVTIGGNFADDKGNAVLSVGYQQASPVYQGDRNFSFYAIDSFSGAAAGSGTTFPSRLVGATILNRDGTVTPAYTGSKQVNPTAGSLDAFTQPYNFNPLNIFQTPFKRYNIYGAAHFDLSDSLTVYTRGLYSKNSVTQILAESGAFGLPVVIPFSNPYLPTAARNQICAGGGLTAAQCTAASVATNPSDPNYLTFRTTLGRRAIEAGPRVTTFRTNVFDYRAGFRGDLSDKIHFDVNGSYGESDSLQIIQGNTLNSRFEDALLATNANTCLSGNAGCVPVNIFGGAGSITPAQLSYLTANASVSTNTSLGQVHGQITGEIPFTSPWAGDAISFAVGGEYRDYKASVTSDQLTKSGDIGGSGGATPDASGEYYVYEGFGELDLPIVQDKPFFKLLDIQAGVRNSHYTVDTPGKPKFSTTTWKAGLNWQPVRDIKFRGNYQHAVRAPNIFELFQPVSTGLTNLSTDPCSGNKPVANAQVRAVCLAQGAPAFTIGSIEDPTAGQANLTSGGNPNLTPEKSNSYTLGVVLQPTFVSGLTVTIDYYNIKIARAITTPTPQDLIDACFDNPDPASVACTVIRRDPNTGQLDGDPASTPGLLGGLSNNGKIKTSGFDLTANYTYKFNADTKINLSFNGNYTRENKFQAIAYISPQFPKKSINRECVGYYSVNCSATDSASPGSLQPKFSWTQRTTVTVKDIDLSLNWRHISHMKYEPAAIDPEDLDTVPFNNVLDPSTGLTGKYNFGRIKAFNYLDFTVRAGVTENFDLTATVYNLANKKPPIVGYNIGSTAFNSGNTYPSTYDPLGRRFAVSAHVKF